jgi:hypothetical protein
LRGGTKATINTKFPPTLGNYEPDSARNIKRAPDISVEKNVESRDRPWRDVFATPEKGLKGHGVLAQKPQYIK